MLHFLSPLLTMMVAVTPLPWQETSPDPDFLESIRIVEVRPEKGEITFETPEGTSRTLEKGDLVEGVEGARVKEIHRRTLVLERVVRGGNGQEGEALIVVRFDRSGKTKVREYRKVPDVSLKKPHRPHDP